MFIEAPQSTPREMETDPVLQSASIRKILGYKVLSFLVAIPSSSSVFSCFRPPLFAYPPSFGPPSPPL